MSEQPDFTDETKYREYRNAFSAGFDAGRVTLIRRLANLPLYKLLREINDLYTIYTKHTKKK